jgi:hypothetical protein
VTYFRARGDSFTLIASIGLWIGDGPKKGLSARGLKLWYDAELTAALQRELQSADLRWALFKRCSGL